MIFAKRDKYSIEIESIIINFNLRHNVIVSYNNCNRYVGIIEIIDFSLTGNRLVLFYRNVWIILKRLLFERKKKNLLFR